MTTTFVGCEATTQDIIPPKNAGVGALCTEKIPTALLLRVLTDGGAGRHLTSLDDVDAIAFGDKAESEFAKIPVDERAGKLVHIWH